MEEIWKDIKGCPDYRISNYGRVMSLKRGLKRVLKPQKDKDGYLICSLWENNKGKTLKIHRLVAEAFIPNPDNKTEIDHINTDKTDNTVWFNEDGSINYEKTNIRWATPKENRNNPISLDRLRKNKYTFPKNTKNPRSCVVLQYDKEGNFIREWDTMSEAEKYYNKNRISTNISSCCRNKCKTAYGYIWKYKRTA